MWEELVESNSYHSLEAAGDMEPLFTKSVSSVIPSSGLIHTKCV